MIESVFMNLARGNRLTTYLGYRGEAPKYARDYQCLEAKLEHITNLSDESVVSEVKRGQTVRFSPACEIAPQKYRCLVVSNPLLQEYSTTAGTTLLEPGDTYRGVVATFRKDYPEEAIKELPWLVRIYLIF